jgi:hypothetical protein
VIDDSEPDHRYLPSAREDAARAEQRADTAQTRSASYRLAFTDRDFLRREELRPVRLQLELLKPELELRAHGIDATIVCFGSARIQEPAIAARRVRAAERLAQAEPGNGRAIAAAAAARRLAEQAPNPFITPELCFQFHYFALRKMHLLTRARALVVFPGGFGTLDELFETLCLIQTGKAGRMPVLLFGERYWREIVDFEAMAAQGVVDHTDLALFSYVETAEQAWRIIEQHCTASST